MGLLKLSFESFILAVVLVIVSFYANSVKTKLNDDNRII